jgi:hypothetical protein
MKQTKVSVNLGSSTLARGPRAAEVLGVSVRTLEKWRLTGQGPRFIRLGRAVRYALADLEAFAAAGARRSTSEGDNDR